MNKNSQKIAVIASHSRIMYQVAKGEPRFSGRDGVAIPNHEELSHFIVSLQESLHHLQ